MQDVFFCRQVAYLSFYLFLFTCAVLKNGGQSSVVGLCPNHSRFIQLCILCCQHIYRNSVKEQVGLCAMKVFSHFFNELNLDACASLMQCVLGSFRALIGCSLDGFEISLVCCMVVLRSMDFLCLVLWQWISELLSFPVLVDWMIISCK